MATLEKIRNRAGLLIAVVGVALFAFIIGDFLNSGTTYWGNSREKIGKVAGKELSIYEFQKDMATATEVLKMQYRQTPPDGEVRDMVWNSFVEQSLLNSEAEEVGLSVTPVELKDVTLGENIHPIMRQIPLFYNEQGAFDQSILINVLSNMDQQGAEQLRDYWLYWENRIKEQVLAEKYQMLILKAMSATNAEAAILADLNSKEMDVACARKPYYSVPDSTISVTDQELQAKYSSIKERFKTDGYRSLKAIIFDIVPSPEDQANTEALAQDAKVQLGSLPDEDLALYVSQVTDPSVPYNPSFRTENEIDPVFKDFAFIAPKGAVADVISDRGFYKTAKVMSDVELRSDSVKVSHILIQRATEAEAQHVADSLVTVLKNGADFASLVAQYSADKASIPAGGDLSWIKEGTVGLESFDNTVFPAKLGDVVTVAIPQQGVHVMKITGKTTPVKKVKLVEVASKIEPSTATYSKIYNQANQFILANHTLESFEAAAKEQGLMVRPLDRLAKNQSSAYGIEQSRPIIKWAWENKEGAVSEVFEVPNMFMVAAVSEVVESGYIPFKNVSAQVKSEVIKDKKAELFISELKGVTNLESISQVDTLRGVKFSQNSVGNIGREPVIPAVAYATGVNEMSAPVKGNMGVYVLKVLDKRDLTVDLNKETQLLNDNIFSAVSRGLFESLKKNAKIEDNRFNFY